MGSKKCPVDPAVLQGFIDRIVKCDRLLAIISIQDAAAAGLNPKKVAEDLAMVAKGTRSSRRPLRQCHRALSQCLASCAPVALQVGLNSDGSTRLRIRRQRQQVLPG